jgi:tetratricopeptide (TPR) repeat protein
MTKGIIKFLLLLWAVLALSCRSGPVSGSASASADSPGGPERPESGVESIAEGEDGSLRPAVPPAAAAASVPPAVTLPLPEADRPEEAAIDGFDLPMPALASSAPLAELNRLPPDIAPAVAWPPLDAYWRRADAAAAAEPVPEPEAAPEVRNPPAGAALPRGESALSAPPAGAPATAPAPAAAPAAAAEPAAAPAREILARRDDRVEILFDGPGWIFLGSEPEIDEEAISFLARESDKGQTSFIFRVHELGSFSLDFQLQDSKAGTTRKETMVLNVLPEAEFDRRLATARNDAVQTKPGADYSRAENLFSRGELELALIEFIRNYRDQDSYANDRIATIYLSGGEYEAALKYYRRNLDAEMTEEDYRSRAVLGVMRAGLALEDEDLVLEVLEDFLALRSLPVDSELVDAARLQLNSGRAASARLLLREYRTRYPRGKRMDEVLFMLGRLHEQNTPLRDLEVSRAYYQRVYEEYPESLLADEAYERLRYLDRHFFHVQ